MISDMTHPNSLALNGPCSWNIKRHNPRSDMKEVTPKWPFLSTFHLIRHYSHQKQQNTTLFKGRRQELSPGEHSSCRNTVAVTGAKCRPPGGATVLRHQLIGTSFQRYHRGFADAQTKDILQREMGMACPHWLVRNKRN